MTLRLVDHPQPPADLGDAAIVLWQHRYAAEQDVIASVTPDPAKLWPTLGRCGINLSCFDADPHRIVFVLMEQHRQHGALRVLDLTVQYWRWQRWNKTAGYRESLWGMFDRFPPSIAHTEYQCARLRDLVAACRDADRHLQAARRTVNDALMRHDGGPFTTKQHRGPGGNTGGDKHHNTRPVDGRAVVKRSA